MVSQARSASVRISQDQSESVRVSRDQSGSVRTGRNQSGSIKISQGHSGSVRSNQDQSGPVRVDPDQSGSVCQLVMISPPKSTESDVSVRKTVLNLVNPFMCLIRTDTTLEIHVGQTLSCNLQASLNMMKCMTQCKK